MLCRSVFLQLFYVKKTAHAAHRTFAVRLEVEAEPITVPHLEGVVL